MCRVIRGYCLCVQRKTLRLSRFVTTKVFIGYINRNSFTYCLDQGHRKIDIDSFNFQLVILLNSGMIGCLCTENSIK